MNRKFTLIAAGIVVLVVIVASACFVVTPASRVLLMQFGRIVGSGYAPGLHFKWPFIQDVSVYDARLLTLDNQTQTFSTADKKNLQVSYFVKWKIGDTQTYYRVTGGQELVAMDRLSAVINRGLRDEFAAANEKHAIGIGKGDLLQGLGKDTDKQIAALGVDLVDLRVRNIQLPKAELDSVYDRMRADRKDIAAKLRAQGTEAGDKLRNDADTKAAQLLADAQTKAQKIRGEGDAEASQIYTTAYSHDPEFFSFYRSLNAYRAALSDKHDVLVLRPDSEFFRYFRDGGVAK